MRPTNYGLPYHETFGSSGLGSGIEMIFGKKLQIEQADMKNKHFIASLNQHDSQM